MAALSLEDVRDGGEVEALEVPVALANERDQDHLGFSLGAGAGIPNDTTGVQVAAPRQPNKHCIAASSQRDRDLVVVVVAREDLQRHPGEIPAPDAAFPETEEWWDATGLPKRDLTLGIAQREGDQQVHGGAFRGGAAAAQKREKQRDAAGLPNYGLVQVAAGDGFQQRQGIDFWLRAAALEQRDERWDDASLADRV